MQVAQPFSTVNDMNFENFIKTTHNSEFKKVPRTICKSDMTIIYQSKRQTLIAILLF